MNSLSIKLLAGWKYEINFIMAAEVSRVFCKILHKKKQQDTLIKINDLVVPDGRSGGNIAKNSGDAVSNMKTFLWRLALYFCRNESKRNKECFKT